VCSFDSDFARFDGLARIPRWRTDVAGTDRDRTPDLRVWSRPSAGVKVGESGRLLTATWA